MPIDSQPSALNDINYPFIGHGHEHKKVNKTAGNTPTETTPLITGDLTIAPSQGNKKVRKTKSEFSLQTVNDTFGRWTKKIPNYFRYSKNVLPKATEIHYSVFKTPLDIRPLSSVPPGGFLDLGPTTRSDFDEIVRSGIQAMVEHNIKPSMIPTGSSGSYFIYNSDKKIIGVFKPQDEEPYGPLSPKMTKWIHRNFFPCFFGRSCLIPNTGYIAESAASLMDRQLMTFIVPYTDVVSLSSDTFYYPLWEKLNNKLQHNPPRAKTGSFQLFLHGYTGADEFFKRHPLPLKRGEQPQWFNNKSKTYSSEFKWTPSALRSLREEIEKMVVLDFIVRNTDRGLDNWMLKVDSADPENPTIKLGAIDNGLAFPWKHPNEWRSFPYGWLYLPLSIIGHPFSDKTRKHFLPMLTSTKWWEDTSILLREMFARDAGFKERMFKKQLAVLKGQAWNVVDTLSNPSLGPLDLARKTRVLIYDSEIEVPMSNPITMIISAMETNINERNKSVSNSPVKRFKSVPENEELSSVIDEHEEESEFGELRNADNNDIFLTDDEDALQNNWNRYLNGDIDERRYEMGNNSIIERSPVKNTSTSTRFAKSGSPNRIGYGINDGISPRLVDESYPDPFDDHAEEPIPNTGEQLARTGSEINLIAPATKTVIIERLQAVTSRPPVFTCC